MKIEMVAMAVKKMMHITPRPGQSGFYPWLKFSSCEGQADGRIDTLCNLVCAMAWPARVRIIPITMLFALRTTLR